MNKIKFVYFDVGGVLIIDFTGSSKFAELRSHLNLNQAQDKAFVKLFDQMEGDICRGLNVDVFVQRAKSELGIVFPENYNLLDEFVKRFEANPQIQSLIDQVSKDCRLGLLTNMYPGMLAAINARAIMPKAGWSEIIDSSIEQTKKPEARIFEIAEHRAGVQPEEILYIDNSSRHVAVAKSRGWHALVYNHLDYQYLRSVLIEAINNINP